MSDVDVDLARARTLRKRADKIWRAIDSGCVRLEEIAEYIRLRNAIDYGTVKDPDGAPPSQDHLRRAATMLAERLPR